jgi:hypothetical protein
VTERNERSRCEGHHLEGNAFDPQFVLDERKLDHGNHTQVRFLDVEEEQNHLDRVEEDSQLVVQDSWRAVRHVD